MIRSSFLLTSFSLLLVLQGPLDGAPDALGEADEGLVAEAALGLGDVVVAGHAAVDDALAVEGRGLADEGEEELAEEAEGDAEVAAEHPLGAGGAAAAGRVPDGAHHVPEVDGGVVGDEEGLAVDALVVERDRGRRRVRRQQRPRRQQVRVRHVLHVREVEQVRVRPYLHPVFALPVDLHRVVHQLHVALAEDPRGPDRRRQEAVRFRAVRGEDELLGFGLWGGGKGKTLLAKRTGHRECA